jgi:hypothetical protein
LLENRVVERFATIPRSVNNRSRITNGPRRLPVSGRTALGRRIADFADGYAATLGGWPGLSEVICANVTALVEQKRADALRDGNVDPLAVVCLDGAANRAVRALQLDRPRESESLSLEEHFRAAFQPGAAEPQGDLAASPRNAPHGRTAAHVGTVQRAAENARTARTGRRTAASCGPSDDQGDAT